MYQVIRIEDEVTYIPFVGDRVAGCQFHASTYFIRGLFSHGHYNVTTFYARLGELEVGGAIRNLSYYHVKGSFDCDHVFFFDAADSLEVMKLFVRLNDACVGGYVPPLPDLEFVHPAAHALLYSLGRFSGDSADCYIHVDPCSVDLNKKVR